MKEIEAKYVLTLEKFYSQKKTKSTKTAAQIEHNNLVEQRNAKLFTPFFNLDNEELYSKGNIFNKEWKSFNRFLDGRRDLM